MLPYPDKSPPRAALLQSTLGIVSAALMILASSGYPGQREEMSDAIGCRDPRISEILRDLIYLQRHHWLKPRSG
ncbi:hypothetical protein BDW59DRAFT_87686 [Aspergillus cavernicola]|uniref:Uncharacterized protein n=1 Tax=Aspergillus cavernicola TaxID=176166 RepID=A0ABR4I937_9EURO